MDQSYRGKIQHPPRILKYRHQVRIIANYTRYLSYFFLLISLVLIGFYLAAANPEDAQKYLSGAFRKGIVFIILYLQYWLMMRPLALSQIQVFSDHLIIKQGKKEIKLDFSDVVKIKSTVYKNAGGWFVLVLKNNKKYRFTIVLERSEYILDGILKYNPQLMDAEKYQSLRKKLILMDHGFGRLYDLFGQKYRLVTLTYGLFFPLIFIIILYLKQKDEFIIHIPILYFLKISFLILLFQVFVWGLFSMVVGVIADRRVKKRLDDNCENKKRDTELESRLNRRLFPAYLILTVLFFATIYQTNLNTLDYTTYAQGSSLLEVEPGELLWFDSRFNCTSCKFSIQVDDLILTTKGLAKVVALPQNKVSIHQKDKKGRFLASVKETVVPKHEVAILVNENKILMIKDRQIRGKIFRSIPHLGEDER